MRISYWSSDVCSSDLNAIVRQSIVEEVGRKAARHDVAAIGRKSVEGPRQRIARAPVVEDEVAVIGDLAPLPPCHAIVQNHTACLAPNVASPSKRYIGRASRRER